MDNTSQDIFNFQGNSDIQKVQAGVSKIKSEISKIVVDQEKFIELVIISMLSNGHSLIEGVPGVAKTLTAKLIAKTIDADFSRIQFTPDLMPSDILGTSIFNIKTQEFEFKKGPIFSNLVLIDEINRAPAKTQAALFEVMAERQISIDGHTSVLPPPFLVFATQNPIEQEGTYRLPEAQLDRFLFKINVDYPSLEGELSILENQQNRENKNEVDSISTVFTKEEFIELQNIISNIKVEKPLLEYIAKIVHNTRENPFLYLGASPRASIAILTSSKAKAAIEGRDFVTPEDIKFVLNPVLTHRIILTPEKEMEGVTTEQVIKQIVDSIEIPR